MSAHTIFFYYSCYLLKLLPIVIIITRVFSLMDYYVRYIWIYFVVYVSNKRLLVPIVIVGLPASTERNCHSRPVRRGDMRIITIIIMQGP